MIKLEHIVSSTKTPHNWERNGNHWTCSVCGAFAMEYDDDSVPDPYGTYVIAIDDSVYVMENCQEVLVSKIMQG